MVETTMTAGLLTSAADVVGGFQGLLLLVLSLGLGWFAVAYLIAQIRAARRG